MLLYGSALTRTPQPDIRFGRYCDAYKLPEKLIAWYKATNAYEKDDFLNAYLHFFDYLKDDSLQNVTITPAKSSAETAAENGVETAAENSVDFYFYQGSKKIIGNFNATTISASAKLAHCETLSVSFLRRVLDKNSQLLYVWFSLEENDIVIGFRAKNIDCPPAKLYQALKELATTADKEDDLLLYDFPHLKGLNSEHCTPLAPREAALKFAFLQEKNKQILAAINALDPKRHTGGAAYLMLDWIYKIDYLLVPERFVMEVCDRVHQHYFSHISNHNIQEKTVAMQREILNIAQLTPENISTEFYHTISTFGISKAATLADILPLIDAQLANIEHFKLLRRPEVAQAIVGYVVGFCFFSYAIPKPVRSLFQLWYQVCEADFFAKLGFSYNYYDCENGIFSPENQANISAEIDFLIEKYSLEHPLFSVDKTQLNFTDLPSFGYSLLLQIRNLSL